MAIIDRWSLVEYGKPTNLIQSIAVHFGLERAQIRDLLLRCGSRAGQILGLSTQPISVSGDLVRAEDIAGILRVGPNIEIEIAPKFLGLDSVNSQWREDFFFLANLSHHGRLLTSERLRAKSGERKDFDTLLARAMVDMYWTNYRRPLRTYRMTSFEDMALDGDVEPEAIIQPSPDGFAQSSLVYDQKNSYNATMFAAGQQLLLNVRDPSLIAQLGRMCQHLTRQKTNFAMHKNRLPNRSKRWQPLHDLSVDVLKGFGLSFSSGTARAPGFVLDTWKVWEDLLSIAIRLELGKDRVQIQKPSVLGTRHRILNGLVIGTSRATVTPDIAISGVAGDIPRFLIDAKYKTRIENGRNRITEPDLYEALAFSASTECNLIVLAYPALPRELSQLGQVSPFETIEVGSVKVIGIEIEIKGISSNNGWSVFSKRLMKDILDIIASN